ncbi:MAG: hypothetical protein II199_02805 [Bacteroidaceae bacterium]|nr:hypothetical protein [Bacteroidaceae bacterium]
MKQLISLLIAAMVFSIPTGLMAETNAKPLSAQTYTSINDDRTAARQALQEGLKEVAKGLPQDLGDNNSLDAIKIEGGYMVFTMTFDMGDIPFEFISLMEKEFKQMMLEECLKVFDDNDKDLLSVAGLGIKVIIKDRNSNAQHNIRIEINELEMGATAQTMSKSKKQEAYNQLKLGVMVLQKTIDSQLPAEMKDAVKINLAPDCLTMTLKVDDRKVSLEDLKTKYSQVSSKELASKLNLGGETNTLCKTAEVNVKIVFQDTESPKYVEFVIPYKDL